MLSKFDVYELNSTQSFVAVALESHALRQDWTKGDYIRQLKIKLGGIAVALFQGKIIGMISYRFRPIDNHVYVNRLIVHTDFRRLGVASTLIGFLKEKFSNIKPRFRTVASDDDFGTQKFLHSLGFIAWGIIRKFDRPLYVFDDRVSHHVVSLMDVDSHAKKVLRSQDRSLAGAL